MTTQTVTPWTANTGSDGQFNYKELQENWGLKPIDEDLIVRIEKISGKPRHLFLKRGIFFAHQDLDKVLNYIEQGKKIFLYTGRGPSGESLHIGHMLSIKFTQWLQEIFDCPVVIMMSDKEKFFVKESSNIDTYINYTKSNAKDIMAAGFNINKTFFFSSIKYHKYMHHLIMMTNKKTTVHRAHKIYGTDDNTCIGQIGWPTEQMVASLCGAFPHLFGNKKDVICLVPCAVDQAPYFRDIRDFAEKFGYPKPAQICSKFLIGLQGSGEKLSTTGNIRPIYMNDDFDTIKRLIRKYAFSGGRDTLKEHNEKGANLLTDVPYIYLCHFLEDDDKLKEITRRYGPGQLNNDECRMTSGEIKNYLIDVLYNQQLKSHQKSRDLITDKQYDEFFTMKVDKSVSDYFQQFCNKYVDIQISY